MASTPVALGAIKEFDPDVERITPYLERVALFLTANGVGEEAEVPAFLSIIEGKAYAVLRDLLAPTATPPKDKTYNVLEDTLRQHYQPTVVVIAERFHFHRHAQGRSLCLSQWWTSGKQHNQTKFCLRFCNLREKDGHTHPRRS